MKLNFANYSLAALTLFYIIMLGDGNYEQLNITQLVVRNLPNSLYILQSEYGFKPFSFWLLFRPLTILLFIVTLIANWKITSRRKLLIVAFGIDVVVTLATFLYFAPETEVIVNIPFDSNQVTPSLLDRAILWNKLNWFRLGCFYAGGILLLISLMREPIKSDS